MLAVVACSDDTEESMRSGSDPWMNAAIVEESAGSW